VFKLAIGNNLGISYPRYPRSDMVLGVERSKVKVIIRVMVQKYGVGSNYERFWLFTTFRPAAEHVATT